MHDFHSRFWKKLLLFIGNQSPWCFVCLLVGKCPTICGPTSFIHGKAHYINDSLVTEIGHLRKRLSQKTPISENASLLKCLTVVKAKCSEIKIHTFIYFQLGKH